MSETNATELPINNDSQNESSVVDNEKSDVSPQNDNAEQQNQPNSQNESGQEIEMNKTDVSTLPDKVEESVEDSSTNDSIEEADSRVQIIYDKAREMIIGKKLDIRQLTLMVPLLMQAAANLKNTTGQQKKQIVHNVMYRLVDDVGFENDKEKQLAQHFIEHDLDDLIDTVYAASKGKFDFGSGVDDAEVFDQEKFKLIYDNIKLLVEGQKLNIKTLVILVPSVMASVSKFTKLTGHQRRLLVIRIFENLLDEYNPRDDTEEMVRSFIKDQLPLIIDTIYAAAKSKYVFDAVKSAWQKIKEKCKCKCMKSQE